MERAIRRVHRLRADWGKYGQRNSPETVAGRVFGGLHRLIELRKVYEVFSGGELNIIDAENLHVLAFEKIYNGRRSHFCQFLRPGTGCLRAKFGAGSRLAMQKAHKISQLAQHKGLRLPALDLLVLG